ncbi:low-specificity D-threonine aldolase [Arcticibacter svalbardensis MN12-7]|uniref:Low-specificity D-threonine aldolase n=1 Tax=Arcticibacter svalbardensis MN12-7 TaxID=1150600 RepID=R9GY90_9SPHI|nr:D-TA family PLP-dependent enzyme [Arcticibacter svalbardensis]EOR96777.1 low-specificity D-threonine aldolase [Arcticibacter svalbardensis MN12-7]
MKRDDNWYHIKNVEEIDTPALIIYHERLIHNIDVLKGLVPATDLLRPHVKTHKSIDVTRLMIEHGINKFKCATIAEAEMLGMCKAKDVLMAYQPTKVKLERLIALIKTYPATLFSCLIDNMETCRMISSVADENAIIIPIFIDLNVGMNRTGVSPGDALGLFCQLQKMAGIKFMGLHAYDGHIKDKNLLDRIIHCENDFKPVEVLRRAIETLGFPYPLLVAGGSPTFAIHAINKNTECSPGTFVFWDKGYHDNIPEQHFLFAALVLTRVVSLPGHNKLCIDLGYKSISCENDLQNRVFFINAPELRPYSQSEEHMVIQSEDVHNYKVGDLLYALPIHICPTVALYDHALININGALKEKWGITSRGRKISI